jgi:hypothetical protein
MLIPFTRKWRAARAEAERRAKNRCLPNVWVTTVQFKPFTYSGPTYTSGRTLALSNWTWFNYATTQPDEGESDEALDS